MIGQIINFNVTVLLGNHTLGARVISARDIAPVAAGVAYLKLVVDRLTGQILDIPASSELNSAQACTTTWLIDTKSLEIISVAFNEVKTNAARQAILETTFLYNSSILRGVQKLAA